MAIVVEDSTGVPGAESYATVAACDAYWAARAHTAFATTWAAATTANKEGSLREATQYLEATWGPFYRGERRGYVQGLLWPRSNALDDAGYPLPDLPQEIIRAVCELAARAASARLADDAARGGKITSERRKVGQIEKEFHYADGTSPETRYGFVDGLLTPVLNGSQPSAASATWFWR